MKVCRREDQEDGLMDVNNKPHKTAYSLDRLVLV